MKVKNALIFSLILSLHSLFAAGANPFPEDIALSTTKLGQEVEAELHALRTMAQYIRGSIQSGLRQNGSRAVVLEKNGAHIFSTSPEADVLPFLIFDAGSLIVFGTKPFGDPTAYFIEKIRTNGWAWMIGTVPLRAAAYILNGGPIDLHRDLGHEIQRTDGVGVEWYELLRGVLGAKINRLEKLAEDNRAVRVHFSYIGLDGKERDATLSYFQTEGTSKPSEHYQPVSPALLDAINQNRIDGVFTRGQQRALDPAVLEALSKAIGNQPIPVVGPNFADSTTLFVERITHLTTQRTWGLNDEREPTRKGQVQIVRNPTQEERARAKEIENSTGFRAWVRRWLDGPPSLNPNRPILRSEQPYAAGCRGYVGALARSGFILNL